MGKRKHMCDCDEECHGVPTDLSASEWKRHKKYRIARVVNAVRDVLNEDGGALHAGLGAGFAGGIDGGGHALVSPIPSLYAPSYP